MRVCFATFFLIAIIASILGCSSSNPATPNDKPLKDAVNSDLAKLPVWVSDRFSDGSPSKGVGVMGIFAVTIDAMNLQADLTSLRQTSLTDTLEAVDITNFLALAPCTNCVKIESVELNADEDLVLKIGIKHPFEAGDPLKPITGRNRADLHVFNVEGIVLMESGNPVRFNGLNQTVENINLLSDDGYTSYLDTAIDPIFPTEATIHPYVLHFDDYSLGNFDPLNPMGFTSVTDPPPSGNLVMAMGCDYDVQDYVFELPFSSFSFGFAVGCTYAVSAASKSLRFSPEYRVPQHLKKAASEVGVRVTRNELMAGSQTSEADIEISVVDRSHGVAVGEALDQMLALSDVSSIQVDIPGILNAPEDVPLTPISGTGHDPSDPLIYSHTITNEMNASEGSYSGLVKIKDSYAPGLNESPLLNGQDGMGRVDPLINPLTALFDIPEFATYQTFIIEVAFENEPPQVGPVTGCGQVIANHPFTFYVTATDPNPGQTLTYYWDDGQHTPGIYDDAITTIGEAELTHSIPEQYTVDVRVDDGVGGVATSSDPLVIIVVPDGVFVDADNAGDPGANGTWDHPYPTIQLGINNSPPNAYVYVFPAAVSYSSFQITSSPKKVVGFDPECGLERPTISVTGSNIYMNSSTNSTIENLIFNFNYTTNGGTVEFIVIRNSNNIVIRNCRFTGVVYSGYSYVLRLDNVDNSTVKECEFVGFRINCTPNQYRYAFMITGTDCSYFTVMHNEMHDIGIPDLASETDWSGLYAIRFGYPNSSFITIKNNLIYDFWDHSPAIPPPSPGDKSNVLHAMSLGNTSDYLIDHNTIDDFDCNNGDPSKNAWTVGLYCGMSIGVLKNNIFKSQNYHIGPLIYHWSAGFWSDSADYVSANYSCVYWGNPPPPPFPSSQCASYLNRISQGVGSYNQDQLVDPDFDYTPGSNYYHPKNATVLTGSETGDEMGCFGGPDGDWTPPSQIYG